MPQGNACMKKVSFAACAKVLKGEASQIKSSCLLFQNYRSWRSSNTSLMDETYSALFLEPLQVEELRGSGLTTLFGLNNLLKSIYD